MHPCQSKSYKSYLKQMSPFLPMCVGRGSAQESCRQKILQQKGITFLTNASAASRSQNDQVKVFSKKRKKKMAI